MLAKVNCFSRSPALPGNDNPGGSASAPAPDTRGRASQKAFPGGTWERENEKRETTKTEGSKR